MSVDADSPPASAQAIRDTAGAWRAAARDPDARPALIHRVILVIAAFSLFSILLSASGPTVRWGSLGLLLAAGVCALVAVIVGGFTAGTMLWFGRLEKLLLAIAIGALAIWMLSNIINYTPYRSDEEIFVQYSANLLRGGHNPYSSDLMHAYAQYPAPFPTKLLDGGITHSLDYPALPTLLTLGLTYAIGDFHTVAVLCTLALAAAAVVMFVLLPKGLRSLAPLLVVGIPVLATGASGGLLFCLVIAPLAFAAYRWQHTCEGGRFSRYDYARAAAIGIAVSTTQVAWFPIPFLFIGIYLCRRRELGRRAAMIVTWKFIGLAAAVFLVINGVFIVWDPSAWMHGMLAPLTQHAVPEGQGLINLIQSLSIGSGNLSLYTYAGGLVMIGLLVAYWRHFDRLKTACFALPLVGLLFPARSYWTYFIAYGAAWMVELLSHDPEESGETAENRGIAEGDDGAGIAEVIGGAKGEGAEEPALTPAPISSSTGLIAGVRGWIAKPVAVTVAAFVPAALVFGAALLSPQPLKLTIDNVVTSAQLGSVQTVYITATNTTGTALQPHFMAVTGDGLVTPTWNIVSGPVTVPPHSKAEYTISAPSFNSLPSVTKGLKIQAVTDQPPTISFSASRQVEPFTTILTFQEPTVPLLDKGASIVLTARIESNFGQPLHRAGVPVCLGQVLFSNTGNVDQSASIIANPSGEEYGCGVTDSMGTVQFTVSANSTQGRLLYFQSHADMGSSGRFGYSTFVTASWK